MSWGIGNPSADRRKRESWRSAARDDSAHSQQDSSLHHHSPAPAMGHLATAHAVAGPNPFLYHGPDIPIFSTAKAEFRETPGGKPNPQPSLVESSSTHTYNLAKKKRRSESDSNPSPEPKLRVVVGPERLSLRPCYGEIARYPRPAVPPILASAHPYTFLPRFLGSKVWGRVVVAQIFNPTSLVAEKMFPKKRFSLTGEVPTRKA